MILGVSIATFVVIHVVISLVAIAAGIVAVIGMVRGRTLPGWTVLFLLMTVLTTVTGFMFPITVFTPALGTGIVSSAVLIVALFARYGKRLAGAWRWIYVVTAVAALYLNVFVLVVQIFQKIRIVNPLAPQLGPPFAEPVNTQFLIAQVLVLAVFIAVGFMAARRYRPALAVAM